MRRIRRPKRVIKRECFVETKDGRIPLILTRSTGRRTMSITVDEAAQARIAAPFNLPDQDIADFLIEKSEWISRKIKEARHYRAVLDRKDFAEGHQFLFLGTPYRIQVVRREAKRSQVSFDPAAGWTVSIPVNHSPQDSAVAVKGKMFQWYRAQAQEILGGRVFHFSRIMGVEPKTITVRTQKRLWGCCDYNKQSINLNWQIILSPLDVVDYVVVHELCHLTVPNHSKRFWKLVEKIMPDFKWRRQWLKANYLDMALP